jgi:TonB family protein
MLAAIFGCDEIVSLLLAAGADVRLKDSLGLTATEWSVRRGFSSTGQIITNASTPELPRQTNETTGAIHLESHPEGHSEAPVQAHRAKEAIHGQPAAKTEIASEPDGGGTEGSKKPKAALGAAGLAMLRARAAQIAGAGTGAETPRHQTTVAQIHAPGTTEGTLTEELKPAMPEAQSTTTQRETTKLRIEPDRMFEESSRVAEEDAANRSEGPTQPFNEAVPASQRPAPLTIPAAALAPTSPASALANESQAPANVKRCPKCHKVYKNTLLVYCPRDTIRLWTSEVPSVNHLLAPASGHPILWVLIAITLGGTAFVTYRLTNHSFETVPHTPVVTTERGQPRVAAVKPLPVVGGALVGAELNVTDPEYPTEAAGKNHREGISGTVTVVVQVNRKGKVISTHVFDGDWPLRMAATKAARKATFAPEKLDGKGRVVTGTITYTFVAPQTEPPVTTGSPAASPPTSPTVTESSATSPQRDLPVSGDALAGAEINLPQAEYPESAKSRGISGTITITVRVNRAGRVISWLTSGGDPRLRAASLKAAKKAIFAPEKLPGKGQVVGTITYNFKL